MGEVRCPTPGCDGDGRYAPPGRGHAPDCVAGGEPPAASPASKAFAFAALEAILAGEWDRYLLRLRGAIEQRRKTPGYQAHIVAGGTDD